MSKEHRLFASASRKHKLSSYIEILLTLCSTSVPLCLTFVPSLQSPMNKISLRQRRHLENCQRSTLFCFCLHLQAQARPCNLHTITSILSPNKNSPGQILKDLQLRSNVIFMLMRFLAASDLTFPSSLSTSNY